MRIAHGMVLHGNGTLTPSFSYLSGLGITFAQQATTGAAGGATVGYGVAQATGSAVAGAIAGGLIAAAPFTGPAAPFLIAAASLVAPIAKMFAGCGATCTQATKIINDATAAANQIRDMYLAQPVHYKSSQTAALQHIAQLMDYVRQSSSTLGAAGQRGVHENLDRGATSTWCPAGGCGWNELIVDPIANDPHVVNDPIDPSSVEGLLTGGLSSLSSLTSSSLFLPLALLGVGLLLVAD